MTDQDQPIDPIAALETAITVLSRAIEAQQQQIDAINEALRAAGLVDQYVQVQIIDQPATGPHYVQTTIID